MRADLSQMGPKHTWPVLCNDSVDHTGFYTVKNEIANSGHQMSIRKDGDPFLYTMSAWAGRSQRETYLRGKFFL